MGIYAPLWGHTIGNLGLDWRLRRYPWAAIFFPVRFLGDGANYTEPEAVLCTLLYHENETQSQTQSPAPKPDHRPSCSVSQCPTQCYANPQPSPPINPTDTTTSQPPSTPSSIPASPPLTPPPNPSHFSVPLPTSFAPSKIVNSALPHES